MDSPWDIIRHATCCPPCYEWSFMAASCGLQNAHGTGVSHNAGLKAADNESCYGLACTERLHISRLFSNTVVRRFGSIKAVILVAIRPSRSLSSYHHRLTSRHRLLYTYRAMWRSCKPAVDDLLSNLTSIRGFRTTGQGLLSQYDIIAR